MIVPHRPTFVSLLMLALLLWGGEYVRRDLWEPDEARYAYVTREMRENGHWAVLHRHGVPYAHKPPLFFWLIRLSAYLTGGYIHGVSVRLPTLAGSLLTLWVTARLAGRWASAAAAWRSVLVLMTSYLFWNVGGMGQTDGLLCGLQMAGLYLLVTSQDASRRARLLGAYTCLGLAILTKGPVGLIVPLGIYLSSSLAAGDRRRLRTAHWIWGVGLALLFPTTWIAAAWAEGAPREHLFELLWTQNVRRAAGELGHVRPAVYYLIHFPIDYLPWTLFLPAAWLGLGVSEPGRILRRRLAAWTGFVIGLFSLSPSKRDLYVLTAFPACAIGIAAAWDSLSHRGFRWTGWIASLLAIFVGVCALVAAVAIPLPIPGGWLIPSAVTFLGGGILLGGMLWRARRTPPPPERRSEDVGLSLSLSAATVPATRAIALRSRWFAAFCATMFTAQVTVANFVYPAINPLKTPWQLAQAVQRRISPERPLYIYGMNGEILALYAHRPGRRLEGAHEIWQAIQQEKRGIIVFEQHRWAELADGFRNILHPHPFRMGNKHLVWCEFDLGQSNNPR